MNSSDLYRSGKLHAAIEAAIGEVKQKPSDVPSRFFLAELLCFAGDLDRADKQLEVLSKQDTQSAMMVSLFRQLIRGEIARQQVFQEGRAPEIATPLTDPFAKRSPLLPNIAPVIPLPPLSVSLTKRRQGPWSQGSATASPSKEFATWMTGRLASWN